MFTNVSHASAGAVALGAHAVLFGPSRAAGFDCVAGDEVSSFFADSSAMSVDTSAQNFTVGLSRFESAWLLKGPPPPPPGGGARRPGAPGAPAGGSGNGGGPKNNITVDDVLVILHQLEMKRPKVSLLLEELSFLEREGLIERMSDEDYRKHEKSLLCVDLLNRDLKATREEQGSLSKSRSKLLQKHNDRWHITFTGRKKLAEEDAELKRSADRLKEISERIEQVEQELNDLEFTKEYLATFVQTHYGYMRLSRKGGQLLKEIKTRNRE